jgi:hypothetical protein
MPLHPSFTFTQDSNDISIGVFANTTPDYGTGGNPARSDAAEYILWSKTNQSGNRVFDNPIQGDVLTNLNYNVNTPEDGYYEGIRLRIGIYNNGASYVEEQESGGEITQYASIVYYGSTDKIYKATNPGSGNLPTDTDFWEEVPEEDWSDLIPNTNVEVYIEKVRVQPRVSKCISSKFASLDDCTCQNNNDRSNKSAYYLNGLLISADSEWANGNYEEYEKIIRQITSKCSTD